MSALPAMVRGWCPSLFRPMESGDGFLARIRPWRGCIPAPLARTLSKAARAYGNGIVEVTNRANLQARGLRAETIAPFTAALEAASAGAAEGSRVLLSPLAGADPALPADLLTLVEAIDAVLPQDLPAKFGVLIDGGGALPMGGLALDITLRFADGVWQVNGEACAPAALPGRVAALAGHTARRTERAGRAPTLGFTPLADAARGFLALAPAFGQMQAEALAALADLASLHGDGALRPTPWKTLLIAGVAAEAAAALAEAAARLGFITDAADGRLSIRTCPGAPACLRGEIETRVAALALAAGRNGSDPLWHLSGCGKGCAHPGAAAATLIGRQGRFDLVIGGKADDTPAFHALTLAQIPALMQSLAS